MKVLGKNGDSCIVEISHNEMYRLGGHTMHLSAGDTVDIEAIFDSLIGLRDMKDKLNISNTILLDICSIIEENVIPVAVEAEKIITRCANGDNNDELDV